MHFYGRRRLIPLRYQFAIGMVVLTPVLLSKVFARLQAGLEQLQQGPIDPTTWALTTAVFGAVFMAFLSIGFAFYSLQGPKPPNPNDRLP